jgi:hypothetical protein
MARQQPLALWVGLGFHFQVPRVAISFVTFSFFMFSSNKSSLLFVILSFGKNNQLVLTDSRDSITKTQLVKTRKPVQHISLSAFYSL